MDDDIIEVIIDEANPEVKKVLDEALKDPMEYVLVLGQDKEGGWYFSSSDSNPERAVYAINNFKAFMLGMD